MSVSIRLKRLEKSGETKGFKLEESFKKEGSPHDMMYGGVPEPISIVGIKMLSFEQTKVSLPSSTFNEGLNTTLTLSRAKQLLLSVTLTVNVLGAPGKQYGSEINGFEIIQTMPARLLALLAFNHFIAITL